MSNGRPVVPVVNDDPRNVADVPVYIAVSERIADVSRILIELDRVSKELDSLYQEIGSNSADELVAVATAGSIRIPLSVRQLLEGKQQELNKYFGDYSNACRLLGDSCDQQVTNTSPKTHGLEDGVRRMATRLAPQSVGK